MYSGAWRARHEQAGTCGLRMLPQTRQPSPGRGTDTVGENTLLEIGDEGQAFGLGDSADGWYGAPERANVRYSISRPARNGSYCSSVTALRGTAVQARRAKRG